MEITVDTRELVALERRLALAGKATPQNIKKVLNEIGSVVLKKARSLCPISPSKTDYVKTLKRIKPKQSTARVFTSGALTRSITREVFDERVEIGVPSNSEAQAYAEKIHDEKGKTWKNLGVASVRKGATDKFIFKAQEESESEYLRAVDQLVDKLIKGI